MNAREMSTNERAILDTVTTLGWGIVARHVPTVYDPTRAASFDDDVNVLRWDVDVTYQGRVVLTTTYRAGIAHAPSYAPLPRTNGGVSLVTAELLAYELRHGKVARQSTVLGMLSGAPIIPGTVDVLASVVLDASTVGETFEDWCMSLGYDTDSRKAYAIYQQCDSIALALNRGAGAVNVEKLAEVVREW